MNREDLVQVNLDHYDFSYDSHGRFNGYWHQIKEVMNLGPEQVLEIGVGNKTVADQLRKYGVRVVSLDIDKRLNPDIIGDVKKLPFKSNKFEVIMCFEVLEHLPFEYFRDALRELKRVTSSHIVISIPDSGKYFKIGFKIPHFWEYKKLINAPFQSRKEHEFDGEHYWEINKKDFPLDKIKNVIKKTGFGIKKTFRPYEDPYHRFFVLQK